MAKRSFNERHQFIRNAIKEDLLQFALPAFLIFTAGLLVTFIQLADLFLVPILNLLEDPQAPFTLPLLTILGLALIITGYIIMFVATGTLRRYYSSSLVIREDHQLVTHGIYRFCRHPIYLGALMVATGFPITAASLPGLLIMAALIPVLLNRIRLEERLLTAQFGDAYLIYSETTRKLIPYIY
jgi:protein-S-isoprenylcysteine O-methyltransferase Ste14